MMHGQKNVKCYKKFGFCIFSVYSP